MIKLANLSNTQWELRCQDLIQAVQEASMGFFPLRNSYYQKFMHCYVPVKLDLFHSHNISAYTAFDLFFFFFDDIGNLSKEEPFGLASSQ